MTASRDAKPTGSPKPSSEALPAPRLYDGMTLAEVARKMGQEFVDNLNRNVREKSDPKAPGEGPKH